MAASSARIQRTAILKPMNQPPFAAAERAPDAQSPMQGYLLAVLALLASLALVWMYWRNAQQRESNAAREEFVAEAVEITGRLQRSPRRLPAGVARSCFAVRVGRATQRRAVARLCRGPPDRAAVPLAGRPGIRRLPEPHAVAGSATGGAGFRTRLLHRASARRSRALWAGDLSRTEDVREHHRDRLRHVCGADSACGDGRRTRRGRSAADRPGEAGAGRRLRRGRPCCCIRRSIATPSYPQRSGRGAMRCKDGSTCRSVSRSSYRSRSAADSDRSALRVVDITEGAQVLYSNLSPAAANGPDDMFAHSELLDAFGRRWRIDFQADPARSPGSTHLGTADHAGRSASSRRCCCSESRWRWRGPNRRRRRSPRG